MIFSYSDVDVQLTIFMSMCFMSPLESIHVVRSKVITFYAINLQLALDDFDQTTVHLQSYGESQNT